MAISNPPRGLIVDLITPFKENGDIDGRGLGRQLDRVSPFVQAVLLASPIFGEGINIKAAQREELLDKALVVVRGSIPILMWISCDDENDTIKTLSLLENRLKKRNYSGPVFWVDTPLYYHSNRGLFSHYQQLFPTKKHFFILHNDPVFIKGLARPLKRNNIRTNILKDLAKIDGLGGLIHYGPLDRARNYRKAVRAKNNFMIYDGNEAYFLKHPSTNGVVSKGANLAPRSWSRIIDSTLNPDGNNSEYPDHLQQIWETGEYLISMLKVCGKNEVSLIKYILADIGVIETAFCFAKEDIQEKKAHQLKELVEKLGEIG